MSNTTKDLMNKFSAAENQRLRRREIPLPPIDEMELSLSLSMNGRFGVDPNAKKIKRTLSIPEFMNPVSNEETRFATPLINSENLIRTSSLPVESEEQWRRRKELQSQRRMEARRKRIQKQRNSRAMRNFGEGGSGSEGGGGSSRGLVEGGGEALRRTPSLVTRVGGIGLNAEKEKEDQLVPTSPPQGAIGSSSGTSESEGQQQGQGPRMAAATNSGPQNRTLVERMPSVSTKGEGPDGKRINGFLYNYGQGEEVKILCVCHGMFLTPAEFVKHAGREDVTDPLKHIVVTSI